MGLKTVPRKWWWVDRRIAEAMKTMISTAAQKKNQHAMSLQRQLDRDSGIARKKGWTLRGQQYLFLFIRHFKTSSKLGHYYGIIDLQSVKWMGDDRMEEFRSLWDHYIDHLQKTDVLQDEIEYIFLSQIEQSAEMAHDIAHYHRVHDTHPHKSYAYLYDTLNRHLALKQFERNRVSQVNMRDYMAKGTKLLDPYAAPAEEAEKREKATKNARKEKAKERPRASQPLLLQT